MGGVSPSAGSVVVNEPVAPSLSALRRASSGQESGAKSTLSLPSVSSPRSKLAARGGSARPSGRSRIYGLGM